MSTALTPRSYIAYRDHIGEMLVQRGKNTLVAYVTTYKDQTLGRGAAAVQLAVGDRLAQRDGRGPYRSAAELRRAASTKILPPGTQRSEVSRNQLEAILRQPAIVDNQLGPLAAAATKTICEAMRDGEMVPATALLTIARTVEQGYLRTGQSIGARGQGLQDFMAIAGVSCANGGVAVVFTTHPQFQDADDESMELLTDTNARGIDLDPVTLRVVRLAAVRREFLAVTGKDIPIVLRGERRFAKSGEGTSTHQDLWFLADQPDWRVRVDALLPDARVLAEFANSRLLGAKYEFEGRSRTITNPDRFLKDVACRSPELGARNLIMATPAQERELEEPEDMILLDGTLVLKDGGFYQPLFVCAETETITFLIPTNRASLFSAKDWYDIRAALAPIHGRAGGPSSDDQGLAIKLPFEHALSISSTDWDKTCNCDSLRSFSHAVECDGHWLGGGPDDRVSSDQRYRRAS